MKKDRGGEEEKKEELDTENKGEKGICAPPASFRQLGLNVWERLRSKSGLRGERPVAFTKRERERRDSGRGKHVQGKLRGLETDRDTTCLCGERHYKHLFIIHGEDFRWQHHSVEPWLTGLLTLMFQTCRW